MTITTKTVELTILKAAPSKVLCDGYSKTSIGGMVTPGAGSDASVWQEMTEEEADKLIAENEAASMAEEAAMESGDQ